nr:hypothetical protein [Propionibacteriales bacterium]
MVTSRSEQVAAFYARHARGLEHAVARQVRDRETANDGCARAWEKLLARPDVELDHRGVKWLETVAVREAWRDAGPANEMERLDAEVLEGETVGDRLIGRDDDPQGRMESAERLGLVGELSVDQQRAVVLQAEGFSYEEITGATGASERKVRRDITRGRSKLAALDQAGAGATAERDPVTLLAAARERHAGLALERADAPAEEHAELDWRLGNVAAATRALCADVVERQV